MRQRVAVRPERDRGVDAGGGEDQPVNAAVHERLHGELLEESAGPTPAPAGESSQPAAELLRRDQAGLELRPEGISATRHDLLILYWYLPSPATRADRV